MPAERHGGAAERVGIGFAGHRSVPSLHLFVGRVDVTARLGARRDHLPRGLLFGIDGGEQDPRDGGRGIVADQRVIELAAKQVDERFLVLRDRASSGRSRRAGA
jgi:hypothetical protein